MLGHLVPCGGGKAIALSKPKLLLGKSDAHDLELRFVEGWWYVRRFESGRPLKVNGKSCESARLNPNDVLTIGESFYRIAFDAPDTVVLSAKTEDSQVAPRPAVHKVDESFQLGMLVPCGGGQPILLRKPKILVGRSPEADVVIPQPNVSSRHCLLEFINGYWQMLDLESRNGTTVDGMSFRRKWMLPGSVLGLPGKHRFRLDYQPRGERPRFADDDEAVLPKKSLMELAGLKNERLEKFLEAQPDDGTSRVKWSLD